MDPTKTPPTPADPKPEHPDPEFDEHFQRCMNHHYPHMAKYYSDHVAKHYEGGGMVTPSGTNTTTPTTEPNHQAAIPPHEDNDAVRMQRAQEGITGANYQREVAAQNSRIAALEQQLATRDREAILAQYERDLSQLLYQGFHLDLGEEMKDCRNFNGADKPMTKDQFSRHIQKIKTRYQKDPTAPVHYASNGRAEHFVAPYSGQVEGAQDGPVFTQAHMNDAVKYQEAHPEIPWEDCCEAVVLGKNKLQASTNGAAK